VREKSGFGFGLNHIVEVLSGAETENIGKWRHHELSTYGIGKEMKRGEWQAIGRELIRLGYVRQSAEKFATLQLTEAGFAVLRERTSVTLTKPAETPERRTHRKGEIECDEALFDKLRRLRKQLADERGVPAYIIFSDVTLRHMARNYPSNEMEFSGLSGVGRQKLQEFSEAFLAEIASHLASGPRRQFS
jgi:ATP-dependent DNA helicase RecQ